MISWAAVLALTGFRYSAVDGTLAFAAKEGRHFWSNGSAYGTIEVKQVRERMVVKLSVVKGRLPFRTFTLAGYGKASFPGSYAVEAGQSRSFEVFPAKDRTAVERSRNGDEEDRYRHQGLRRRQRRHPGRRPDASARGLEVLGVMRGYEGLIRGDVVPLDRRSVSGIINLGGTILKSARSEEFFEDEGQKKAVDSVRAKGIDGLIVIGGNGSLAGAHVLGGTYGIPIVGVPATIDNDINGVDLSIGADTAVNVALDAVDKIRDTATSLERIFVVEVMGRGCGYLAMQVALAGGCEEVLLPEKPFDMIGRISNEIRAGNAQGKVSWILIVAEGLARAEDVASAITLNTGLETRIAVLGHIQRGGTADGRRQADWRPGSATRPS